MLPCVLFWQLGYTALIFAAAKGHAECVRLLLEGGADKNWSDKVCGTLALFLSSINWVRATRGKKVRVFRIVLSLDVANTCAGSSDL
jgi:ankyrin repeat protein